MACKMVSIHFYDNNPQNICFIGTVYINAFLISLCMQYRRIFFQLHSYVPINIVYLHIDRKWIKYL
jgi:hypothetical protein